MQPNHILPPKDEDWNSYLQLHNTEAAQRFAKGLGNFRFHADLALAETPREYGELYFEHHGRAAGLFAFNGQYYFSQLKSKGGSKLVPVTTRVSNFTLQVVHFQRDDTDEERPVYKYRLKVIPKGGRPVYVTVDGQELKSADSLTGLFLKHAKCQWCGDVNATKALISSIVESKAPVVRQATITGYDKKTDWFLFRYFAIKPDGSLVYPDSDGFFPVSVNEKVRPPRHITINPAKSGPTPQETYDLLISSWGDRAALAIACLIKSWFVHLFKLITGFDPPLSLHGDPQTGKTNLMKTLNRMQCLDEEGLSMSKANTRKGELRKLSQIASLMKALLEGNSQEGSRFDFESILTLYNYGNPLQTRAMTTNDSRTHDLEFLAALAFVANKEPFRSRAAKERLISVEFKTDQLNAQTAEAFDELQKLKAEELARFFVEVMRHRKEIEVGWQDAFEDAKAELKDDIDDNRIRENFALVLTFHKLLCQVLKIDYDLRPFIVETALKKIEQCRQRDTTGADYFFECIWSLSDMDIVRVAQAVSSGEKCLFSTKKDFLDIDNEKGLLFVHLPIARQVLTENNMMTDWPSRLIEELKQHTAYIEGNKSHKFNGKNRKAYVFNTNKLQ